MSHSRSGSTINEPHRLVLFIRVGHGSERNSKEMRIRDMKIFGFVGTETKVLILVFSSSSAKLFYNIARKFA